MPGVSPTRILGGITLLSTFIATVLDGMCYTFSRSLSSHISSVESAIVSLGAVSCVALVAVSYLWVNDLKSEAATPYRSRGACTYGVIAAYLSIATGVTAGGIAWSAAQSMTAKTSVTKRHQSLLIARCIIWAISVLSQGILGGYFLTTLIKREPTPTPTPIPISPPTKWSPSPSQELDVLSEQASVKENHGRDSPSLTSESQRESADLKPDGDTVPPIQPSVSNTESHTSNRYSGRTLFLHDSKQNSLDLQRSYLSQGDSIGISSKPVEPPNDPAGCPVGAKVRSEPPKIRRSYSDTKRSLDASSTRSSPATSSTQLRLPAPTPMPGTTVIASPAAGQTISVKTLNRVRSTRSLRSQGPRSRSPLFDQPLQSMERNADSPEPSGRGSPMPSFIMAADVRSSISRYEKKYDLNESPDES
ncbi:hypothetical protein BO70DRAFT_432235 [Aspergillus heteromorphus CBS 117.55]|uniref:Uncharacterized protein n=1 Tax=Aspergillus heteromorphus CBS 117.55 TaxID=1448321 RepID=A0A317VB74_9EURO|nr:uncharacterized protein BO70DRAFT_432235 [Aspergillus heteromorphus CBS 117.55]PWY70192.1 hypothetical protein BO70DRAFT_432235 [Aspergillus heteromorphus CBS 117.55]